MADFEGDKSCGPTHHACACFLGRAARLEDENAAKDAALSVAVGAETARCKAWGIPETSWLVGARAALTGTDEGWLPPDKVRRARRAVGMIDASPAGSLNAKFKAEALDWLEVDRDV